ncbi:MAG: DNA ligase-associated DEXH box helicase [Rhodobacterales bacterium 12-64-8]|nr:MAG: DNA ligase-associated DEXH box helicase [Rhodobacterales bacterium 12-64-8]OYX46343.1 MAG: DNA ligase-associated DEXH box helicase [Alphaproteobacteria bacterium 32-64-14]
MADDPHLPSLLPPRFAAWFGARGWELRPHQAGLIGAARRGQGGLVIAPTGGGKTLAGFLPSLIELEAMPPRVHPALHTLYISPLKALATDVARNLKAPVEEMGLDLTLETRTGDTSPSRRQRQRAKPPDILLTTPEQLALLIASEHAGRFFGDLRAVIIDEVHAVAQSKRGDLLALCLATLRTWAPQARHIGLSATVRDPAALARWLGPETPIIRHQGGASANISVLDSEARIPWSGHSGRHNIKEVYQAIKGAKMSLVFVNTRSQAEMTFQELWRVNEDGLPIALHHGSLDVEQRRKVEAAMAVGKLKAVVCTSTLDLGIDWGDVDLVVQMGAPKGSSRLIQRIGRSNHRMDEPSRALLAPSNRFEVLECRAAVEAVNAGELDGPGPRRGGLDVLAQHVMARACGDGFDGVKLYDEITVAAPYADLDWETWERVVDLVATGGYALKTYDRFRRIVKFPDGIWRARNDDVRRQHRMNVGTIIENPMISVRQVSFMKGQPPGSAETKRLMRAGRKLGEMEEYFFEMLTPGDTFLFAGEVLRFEGISDTDALVTKTFDPDPAIPSYNGGKFPLTTFLANRVRSILHDRANWHTLPAQVRDWIEVQERKSIIPAADQLLIETFPRGERHYLVCYPFEGRLAHQTLGMLLTRRLERTGLKPLGFVASEYALSIWAAEDMRGEDMASLFHEDMLGDDLDVWLEESALMKRTFRNNALIAGLIERRMPKHERSGREITFSTDLIYDVLRSHEPDHLLLKAARQDAGEGLLDIRRLGEALKRIKGRIVHASLEQISPFAVPVMLEIGKEPVFSGDAAEAILREAEDDLVRDAMS